MAANGDAADPKNLGTGLLNAGDLNPTIPKEPLTTPTGTDNVVPHANITTKIKHVSGRGNSVEWNGGEIPPAAEGRSDEPRHYTMVGSATHGPAGIRVALKEDIKTSSAELVFDAPLRLPGGFLRPERTKLQHSQFLQLLRQRMDSLRPTPASHHTHGKVFVREGP
ncbi:hypothetical protein JTE90_002935 [Oedothorax gibbosus]|uniref:Uncharacterized protein n=1 Tax=Oedothorax gibbosus TaxID=931172 RepID=A0AAV6UTV9_9ARAC|nr:hypothetical protein JTE90_002935 [Oedothorax gibbosus]